MDFPACVQGAENVIEALGYWPVFHDAEVISFSATRSAPGQTCTTSARLLVNVRQYEEVGCGTADYEVVCSKSLLIELMFTDLHKLSIEDFNHQNVINVMSFNRLEDSLIEVEFESIYGIGGVIRCAQVEVTDVTKLL